MTRTSIRAGLVALLVLAGAWQLAAGAWIHVKAGVAQVLLRSAWARTEHAAGSPAVQHGVQHRPWPWADTAPVARLIAPRLQVDLIVLDGFSGQALAFGPGLVRADDGAVVLSAHRDTHFAFLRDVMPGERLEFERVGESAREFWVRETRVVDYRDAGALLGSTSDTLVLVTCWPFDAIAPGGPLRLLVFAQEQVRS